MKRMMTSAGALSCAKADHAAFAARLGDDPAAWRKKDAPSIADVNRGVPDLAQAFEAFKAKNDEALEEVKTKGATDVVTAEAVERIKSDVLELKGMRDEIDRLAKAAARPDGGPRGEMLTPEQKEHHDAFLTLMRNPEDESAKAAVQQIARKAVSGATDGAGGYAVPEIIAQQVQREILETTDIMSIVNVVRAGSKDFKELVDRRGTAYGWVGETDTRTATATSTLAETAPTFGTLYSYPSITEEILGDAFFDIEGWLVTSISEGHARGIENGVINGDGSNKPTGILNGVPVTTADGSRNFGVLQYVASGAAAAVSDSDALVMLVQTLKSSYRANARWMMNRATAGDLMKLKDGDGNYLWKMGDFQNGQPDRLLGYPVSESEEMPDIAANDFPIAFGDFQAGYTVVMLAGMRMTRDEITTPGYINWYARQRLGGSLRKDEAIKLLKVEA